MPELAPPSDVGSLRSIAVWHAAASASSDPLRWVRQQLLRRLDAQWDPNPVWISRATHRELDDQLQALALRLERWHGDAGRLPLFGVPFAVKDNIDAAGFETTAGCRAYAYRPADDAAAVARLREAGAIVFGKTNLDQFATGLNGTRSPYGAVSSAGSRDHVAGGSSSGSAVAVARGEVMFALGTDTAGSGRVPASLNGIVGLKPTRGRVSTAGVVPACRSLDCVSIFANDVDDAVRVLECASGYEPADPFSRDPLHRVRNDLGRDAPRRLAVAASPEFFGDECQRTAYEQTLARLARQGWIIEAVDYAPLSEAASLLYDGPWIAERDAAVGDFIRAHRGDVDPVVASIVTGAERQSARCAFEGLYRLAALRRQTDHLWRDYAALLLPGVPTTYRIDQMLADPVRLNSRLGHYTNFVNLFDLAALNLPAGRRSDGLPFGVSLVAARHSDSRLAALARRLQPILDGCEPQPSDAPQPTADADSMPIAVVGAHLSGLPLNPQLLERGARLLERTSTAGCYRLFALPGTVPEKPGMVRDATGSSIEIEVWALPKSAWASFLELIPPPLCIGSIETSGGQRVMGFLCEPHALDGAREITGFGGWRAYLSTK